VIQIRDSDEEFPLVTVAIPTYNRASYLKHALASAYAQTYKNIEIIVSDNASNDDTAAAAASFNDLCLKYLRQPKNIGMVGNWNACLNSASGQYFLLLSDDDELGPAAIEDLVNVIRGRAHHHQKISPRDIAFAYGYCAIENTVTHQMALSRIAPFGEPSEQYRIGFLRSQRVNYPSATLFRTNDMRDVGGYSMRYGPATDVGMAFEVSGRYPVVAFTGTRTTRYFFHPENASSSANIDVLVDAIASISQTAIAQIPLSNVQCLLSTRKAAAWAQASALLHNLVVRHFSGSVGLAEVISYSWRYRRLFSNVECARLLLRACIKLGLFTFFGWRKLSSRSQRPLVR